MITRAIISAVRQIKRNKISALINIVGLSFGMACSFITLLYVIGEFSYEKNQENHDQIFRVLTYDETDDRGLERSINYGLLSATMLDELPEVERATILDTKPYRPFYVRTNKEYILEKGLVYNVEPDYFEIFTVPILHGNPGHLIDDPGSLVLSKEMALKYFGEENPIGKAIYFQYDSEDIAYTVTGVIDHIRGNSGFKPDFIVRFDPTEYGHLMGWDFVVFEVFVRLSHETDIQLLEQKMNQLGEKYHPDKNNKYRLQNARKFYLNSDSIYASHLPKGNKLSILIFSGIGILVLLIACINYIILATAQSTLRYREIGIRKVVGANRFGLISQIQVESLLVAFISLPLALLIFERSKGIISEIFGKELALSYAGNLPFIIGFILITFMVGSVSGGYISLHLSRLKPIEILYSRNPQKGSRSIFRKVLIGFQLLIFVILFTSAVTIKRQIKFALKVHPDFEVENLLIINDDQSRVSNFELFKTELENHPDILGVSASMSNILERNRWANNVKTSLNSDITVPMEQYYVDKDYLETIKIKLVKGETFQLEESRNRSAVIINENGASQLGFSDPIGKIITTMTMFSDEQEYEIIGVVKDFISGSVRRDIGAFLIFPRTENIPAEHIAVRLSGKLSEAGKSHIQQVWKEVTGGKPLEFTYMTDLYHSMYKKDIILAKVIVLFTSLAIFISCLGLFGLSLFVARRRNKEIGIRKVFGAQPPKIIVMILKDFLWVVVLANCLAIPITLFAMQKWLSVFAYKVKPDAGTFILGLLLSAFIVGITLTINALKAAGMNPADSLRCE